MWSFGVLIVRVSSSRVEDNGLWTMDKRAPIISLSPPGLLLFADDFESAKTLTLYVGRLPVKFNNIYLLYYYIENVKNIPYLIEISTSYPGVSGRQILFCIQLRIYAVRPAPGLRHVSAVCTYR